MKWSDGVRETSARSNYNIYCVQHGTPQPGPHTRHLSLDRRKYSSGSRSEALPRPRSPVLKHSWQHSLRLTRPLVGLAKIRPQHLDNLRPLKILEVRLAAAQAAVAPRLPAGVLIIDRQTFPANKELEVALGAESPIGQSSLSRAMRRFNCARGSGECRIQPVGFMRNGPQS